MEKDLYTGAVLPRAAGSITQRGFVDALPAGAKVAIVRRHVARGLSSKATTH